LFASIGILFDYHNFMVLGGQTIFPIFDHKQMTAFFDKKYGVLLLPSDNHFVHLQNKTFMFSKNDDPKSFIEFLWH
jgi:hypothetical protein